MTSTGEGAALSAGASTANEAATPWIGRRVLAWGAAFAAYFAALAVVNGYWVCYPTDNDLDEVGWLAANLSLARPESLANQGYPPGLPVLLRGLSPLVGSLLRAAFLWQAVASTASVFFAFRISKALSGRPGVGLLGALCAALATLRVGTTEFADGTSTALFLAGLWALTRREGERRGFLLFGVAAGASYLFRTHYLMLVAIVPVSLVVAGFGWREVGRLAPAFLAGFAATAWPLWLMNCLAYGTPLHAGVSQYNIAFAMLPNAFDWEDYARTYDRWPLSRILEERPLQLLAHMYKVAAKTFGGKLVVSAATLGIFAMLSTPDRQRRRLLALIAGLGFFYIVVVLVPTRTSTRAFAPVAMLTCVLIACGLAELVSRADRPRRAQLWAALAAVFLSWPLGLWADLDSRHAARQHNMKIVDALVAHGMQSSAEVFTNIWSIYNLRDPLFVSFYNYGGWLQLDSKYARERPPPRANTLPEWQAFFAERGIRFVILKQRPDTQALFQAPPPEWKQLFSDRSLTVWAL
jgi:hypothetical protein